MGKSSINAPAVSQNSTSSQNASNVEAASMAPRLDATESHCSAPVEVPAQAESLSIAAAAAPATAPVEEETIMKAMNMSETALPAAAEVASVNTQAENRISGVIVQPTELALGSIDTAAGSTAEELNKNAPLLDRPLMASAQTTEEQASRISAAVARAQDLLDDIRAKVGEYDEAYKASETASLYLGPPLRKAQCAFDKLASTATMLKDKAVEVPTRALNQSLTAANSALANVTAVATKYDEKMKLSSTLRKAVSVPHEKCKEALAEVSRLACLASATASAHILSINQGIRNRAASLANSSASLVFNVAAALDGRLAIEDKALMVGTAIAGKAQKLDDQFHVKEKVFFLATKSLGQAQVLDVKVTRGRIAPMVLSAFESGLSTATNGLSFVQHGYGDAKEQRKAKVETNQ